MTMYGANPDQLAELGAKLRAQSAPIESVISAVDTALQGTDWKGPARETFKAEWDNSFVTTLRKLMDAFGVVGTDCVNRSNDLRTVMGSLR